MKRIRNIAWLRVALIGAAMSASAALWASPVLLTGIPAYDWYHGCGPTAAASVLGYWDLHGYSNLFTAQGNDVYQTANVEDQISSPAHNAKYDPTPDDPNLSVPQMTSIADWFKTSVDQYGQTQGYGWSYLSDSIAAFSGYAAYRGYTFNTSIESVVGGDFTWNNLTAQIDSGHPVMFLVDTSGSGSTDHFVPVFGYEDRGTAGKWYACYNTWHEDESVDWYQFRPMAAGTTWGVGYVTLTAPVPEPATIIALAAGFALLARRRRSK